MMNSIRKYTKTILWIVVIAFVGTIFFVWGMDAGRRKSSLEQISAAVVNGQAISYSDFAQLWEQRYRQIAENSDRELPQQEIQDLRLKLMDALIDATLIQQKFDELKLKVTAQEVAARISTMPAFSENGKFSHEKYLTMLRYNRVSSQAFEAEQASAIKMAKMSQLLQESLVVTAADVKQYFQSRARKLKLQYAAFHWKKFMLKAKIAEAEITAYFNGHRSEFDKPEEVKASHILIRVDSAAGEEDKLTAKLKLDNIRADIAKGENFAEMAKKHSDDPGSKIKGGDLGFFGRGMMVKPFEDAAFSLKTNELSEIVESPFGFHLIKVTGRQAAKKAALADVKKDIQKQLQKKKAYQLSQEAALQFRQSLKKTKSLLESAKATGNRLVTTSWVKEDDSLPGLESSERILDRAFDLPLNQPSDSILEEDDVYFVEVTAEQDQPFNEDLYTLER
ncbi:SurA N-terminal domain-containing protein, partial [bacterium]|nr:SurA N-terminal domain-containing protein [bacterium]